MSDTGMDEQMEITPAGTTEYGSIESQICEVEKEIQIVEQKVEASRGDKQFMMLLMKKEEQLRKKEEQLRKKEEQLREIQLLKMKEKLSSGPGPSKKPCLELEEDQYEKVKMKISLSDFKAEEYYDSLPCYTELCKLYDGLRNPQNSLIILGPKGCSKSTSLKLLQHRLIEKGDFALYVDLGEMDPVELKYVRPVISDLLKNKKTTPKTLLLDNAQLLDTTYIPIGTEFFNFAVAAYSPGARTDLTNIKIFKKKRGDGRTMTCYFRPLSRYVSHKLLKFLGAKIDDPDDSTTESVASNNLSPNPDPTAKALSVERVAELHHLTGGVPRYLHSYLSYNNHSVMEAELEEQFEQVKMVCSIDNLFEEIFTVETTERHPPNLLIQLGIAYVNTNNKVCTVSPKYIHFVLHYKNMIVNTNHDWQKPELLVIFLVRFTSCTVINCKNNEISLPRATMHLVQSEIGKLQNIEPKTGVTLVTLASGHPVVDLILIDHRAEDMKVYFIQVSFSRYSNHRKKRKHIWSTTMFQSNENVYEYYEKKLNFKFSTFIYATTEFELKGTDDEVYFLDLRRQMYTD